MLVQMPLSHTSPASHSSTSAGHKGRQRAGVGRSQASATLFPLVLMAWSTRAEASGAYGKQRRPLTPLRAAHHALGSRPVLPGTLGRVRVQRAQASPTFIILTKQGHPPHPLFPYCPDLPSPTALTLPPRAMAPSGSWPHIRVLPSHSASEVPWAPRQPSPSLLLSALTSLVCLPLSCSPLFSTHMVSEAQSPTLHP